MKISVFVFIACTLYTLNSHSQISVGNLKGKVVDKATKKEKEPSSSSTTTSSSTSNSSSNSSSNSNSESSDLNSRYNQELSNFRSVLMRIESTASSLMENRSKYYHLKEDDNIAKLSYDSIKSSYLSKGYAPNDALRNIQKIDTFYTIYPQKLKTSIMEESIEKMKDISVNVKEARLKPDYLERIANREFVLINPKNMLNHIADYQSNLRKALMFLPEDADITDLLNKTEAIKIDYTEYEKSGDHAKDLVTVNEMRLDKVRCPKAVNTNPNLIAVVKKDFENSAETFLRASITSSDWKVNKNKYGNINDRTMVVYVVYTTATGKCFYEEGELYCRYLEGKWESPKFNFVGREAVEMLSKNAQK